MTGKIHIQSIMAFKCIKRDNDMNRQIKQTGVRVIFYPLVICVFYLVKNLIYDGLLIIKGYNIDTLLYVSSILILCEILSFFVFNKEKAYWHFYLIYCIFLACVLVALKVIGINVELENILIIYIISLLTWVVTSFVVKIS
jgi:hypothetical protein